jgi:NADH:ubiquinone oxidoreductase subunit 4 (subunit M)
VTRPVSNICIDISVLLLLLHGAMLGFLTVSCFQTASIHCRDSRQLIHAHIMRVSALTVGQFIADEMLIFPSHFIYRSSITNSDRANRKKETKQWLIFD